MKVFRFLMLLVIFSGFNARVKADNFGTWVEMEFRKDFLERFSFSITPELRFQEEFKLDEYLIQGKLSVEPFSFLTLATSYRMSTEIKNKGNERNYRYAIDATVSQDFARFEGSFRGRFTNYTDSSDEDPGFFFRPRIKLEYDIKNNKITPFASFELFHNLTDKELQKSRLDAGLSRNFGKLHRAELYYRLHDYFNQKASVHILGIGYRLKF